MHKWIFLSTLLVIPSVNAFNDTCCDYCSIASLPKIVLNTEYSNRYSLIVNPKYANILNPYNAVAVEFAFGASEFRVGTTWAYDLNPCQRLKATAEYLSQDSTFHFLPGSVTQWTEQSSLALAYQYIINKNFFQALNFSVYHSHARDENLPVITFDSDATTFTDYRRISGSDSNGVTAGFAVIPWCYAGLDFDLLFDAIHYHNQGQSSSSRSGVGEALTYHQLLGNRVKFQMTGIHRILFNELSGGVTCLVFCNKHHLLELSLNAKYIEGENIPQPHETRLGLTLAYRWDASHPPAAFCTPCDQRTAALHAWSLKPVVHMQRTFVVPDEHVS